LRNLQARTLSSIILHRYPDVWEGLLEALADHLANGDATQIDFSLRTLYFFIDKLEEEQTIKQFN